RRGPPPHPDRHLPQRQAPGLRPARPYPARQDPPGRARPRGPAHLAPALRRHLDHPVTQPAGAHTVAVAPPHPGGGPGMTAIPAPVNGHWTAADLDRLDDTYRYEIVDGNVLVNASPSGRHQRIILRLAQLLEAQLPEGLLVVPDVDVVLDPENTRRPDLIVAAAELAEQERFAAEDVHLVVEVVSPGSMNADRVAKPAQYATCRIPAYWRVRAQPEISLIE